ncbi:hypothetical protein T484DRAFT_1982444 [Baffinella frigidus]|nr:hypothetical protein T484DRAFT_1982444 [Cryptophyta sp. CCMP2293]
MVRPSSMNTTASKNFLRASVVLLLLPLSLAFAPATSTVHLSALGNRRAVCDPSRALPRVATGPLAATMLDFTLADEQVMGQRRREAARRTKIVLRTAVATLSAVCVLAIATPASAFDRSWPSDVPAMVSAGLSKHAKVDARLAVPQEYTKTTRQALMEMQVKVKHPIRRISAGHRLINFVTKAVFFGASLLVLPWYTFRNEGDLLSAPHLKKRRGKRV